MTDLTPREVVWVAPDATVGREQAGRQPAVVVSGAGYLSTVDALAIVVPVTGVDRGWPNHIPVAGSNLPQRSWAMTEQVRTISRTRITGSLGRVTSDTLAEIRLWIRDFLDLQASQHWSPTQGASSRAVAGSDKRDGDPG